MPANSAPHPTYSPVKNGEREQPEFAARLILVRGASFLKSRACSDLIQGSA